MVGVIGEPGLEKRAKNFGAALFECLFEATELIPLALIALLCIAAVCLVGGIVYHLKFDPNAVDVASRLEALSINPEEWLPRS